MEPVAGSEEVAQRALGADAQWLTYQTAPLAADVRIADAPRLLATVTANRSHGHLVPTLFDIDPAEAGHRIALVVESSNSAWAVPDTPGLSLDVASHSSRLVLPVVP